MSGDKPITPAPPMTDEDFDFILSDHDGHGGCSDHCFWYKDRRYIARIEADRATIEAKDAEIARLQKENTALGQVCDGYEAANEIERATIAAHKALQADLRKALRRLLYRFDHIEKGTGLFERDVIEARAVLAKAADSVREGK